HMCRKKGMSALPPKGCYKRRLRRRTWDRAVRTEYATVTRLSPKPRATSFALIKELAGVSWHLLGRLVPAFWTGNRRSFNQSAARLRCLAVIGKHQNPRLYAASCPRWVKSRHLRCNTSCPLYPQ